MLDALRAKLENAGLEIIDISLSRLVVRSNDHEAELSLHNLYRMIMTSPRENHDKQLQHFTQQVYDQLHVHNNPKILYPLLAQDTPDPRIHSPWSAPLIPNLLKLVLCFEQGERMKLLSPMDIVRSGRSMKDLKKEAMENLFRISSSHKPKLDSLGQYRFEIGDGYDASRFLMIRYWFEKQEIWVALPSRDSLWVRTSPPDQQATSALKDSFETLPYPLLERWIQLPQDTKDPQQQENS
ncbi:MAG: hypothetical protein CL916_05440 [Deltaproteobacteria bacterium]|nr:hypothetical protein [Deltaproteobacteria bacterium]